MISIQKMSNFKKKNCVQWERPQTYLSLQTVLYCTGNLGIIHLKMLIPVRYVDPYFILSTTVRKWVWTFYLSLFSIWSTVFNCTGIIRRTIESLFGVRKVFNPTGTMSRTIVCVPYGQIIKLFFLVSTSVRKNIWCSTNS